METFYTIPFRLQFSHSLASEWCFLMMREILASPVKILSILPIRVIDLPRIRRIERIFRIQKRLQYGSPLAGARRHITRSSIELPGRTYFAEGLFL